MARVYAVFDGVGKDTFEKDLKVLRPRGYLCFWRREWASAALDLMQRLSTDRFSSPAC